MSKQLAPSKRPVINPNNLKAIRERLGLDVYQFCLMLGQKPANYYRIEQGKQMPKYPLVMEMMDKLGMTMHDIFPAYVIPRNSPKS